MTVSSQVSTAEMREAFRLNLNAAACIRIASSNFRSVVYSLVFLGLIIAQLARGGTVDWQMVGGFAALLALILGLFWWNIHRFLAKAAKNLSASGSVFTLDTQGVTCDMPNGSRTSVPWSAIGRWREGKLVFTIGDTKTYRTFSKTTLGEMQSGELRSLLISQIR